MALPPARLFDPVKDKHLIPQLAQIHADCIMSDHTIANFLPPLDHTKLINYWLTRSSHIEEGEREIIIQATPDATIRGKEDLMGYVSLHMPPSETGPFRGRIEKLLVSPKHRQKGVARRVMEKLEEVAIARGRGLLVQ